VAPDNVIQLFDRAEYRVRERPSGPGDAVITERRRDTHRHGELSFVLDPWVPETRSGLCEPKEAQGGLRAASPR
jgi:hypothetical protein